MPIQFSSELERRICEKFDNLQDTATCIKARCPVHNDKKNSLCIATGDNGSIVLYCQAGCPTEAVLDAVGLKYSDLFPEQPKTEKPKGNIFYDYHDENSVLVYKVMRTPNKDFFQLRINPDDGLYVWGLTEGDYIKTKIGREMGWRKPKRDENISGKPMKHFPEQPKVLYHLPEVIQAVKTGEIVFIVEGEKDADNMKKHGFVATTSPGGAGNKNSSKKWRPEFNGYFKSAVVSILPDNDEPGRSHAKAIADQLSEIAANVRIVQLPNLPEKGDVSDYFLSGGLPGELLRIVEDTPPYCRAKGGQPLTDLGNAERLVERHGHNLRFVHAWKQWLIWDGCRWRPDETEEIFRLAKETVRSIRAEAQACDDPDKAKKIFGFACQSEAAGKLKALVSLAQSEKEVSITPKDLDQNDWLFNVKNGTLDLKTGRLEPFKKSDLITKMAPVEYDAAAQCPQWLKFLDRIFEGKQSLVDFVQRITGYILTGDTSEQVMFFLYGTGKNGKSRFIEVLQQMLGDDYWREALTSTLMYKKQAVTNTNDVAMLAGKRLVTSVETEEGQRLAEPLIKQMTGNDPITARFLYQENFTFTPTFKIFVITNHKPVIRGTDEGIWRRVKLIPFNVTIPESERDKRLGEKLRTEYSGILNWMVEGCLKWQRDGLEEPDEVKAATGQYREEMDVIGDFLREYCFVERSARISHSDLYTCYTQYARENNEYMLSSKAFSQKMLERGFTRLALHGGSRGWEGLRLRIEQDNYPRVKGNVTPLFSENYKTPVI